MKKLSIEEKAKRYDEILARATGAHLPYYTEDIMTKVREFVEYLLPELKESEDERTWIINYLSNKILNSTIIAEKENLKKAIAWLEKQGEQKPADNVIEDEKSLLEKFKQAVYDCAWGKITCKKEGETKEEYANRWAEHFLLIVRDWADDYIDFTIQQKLRKSYDKGKENAIKKNISSWSEEDESNLNGIIDEIEANKNNAPDYDLATYDRFLSWLKSLKDRYTWKPSEEQMKALAKASETYCGIDKGVLYSLYNDLKKLKG